MRRRPAVLVVTHREVRKTRYIDYVGELHLGLLMTLGILPVMVPVVAGTLSCLQQYSETMAGLLLVEGEDVTPARYRAAKTDLKYVEATHPLRDEIEIRLIRAAFRRDLPILAICRGSQLLNVASGGSLYTDVQTQKRSTLKHIDREHYDTYRHPISIVPGSLLESWFGRSRLMVNSYHHQGIRRLASRFTAMAHAPDGLVEAYVDPAARFVVGLQFHPERMLSEYRGNRRVWQSFGSAVRKAGLET